MSNKTLLCSDVFMRPYFSSRLTLAEYHEQEEIFKLRLGHLKKVCIDDIQIPLLPNRHYIRDALQNEIAMRWS